jgi:hypothetical protein
MSWRRAHLGTCDQILIPSECCCFVFVGRPLWWEVGSVSCQSQSGIIVHCQVLFYFLSSFVSFFHFTRHTFYVYIVQYMKGLIFQAQYSRSCSIICSLHYNSSLNTWTVVRLTATKYKPLKFSVSPFALHYIADRKQLTSVFYPCCSGNTLACGSVT